LSKREGDRPSKLSNFIRYQTRQKLLPSTANSKERKKQVQVSCAAVKRGNLEGREKTRGVRVGVFRDRRRS